MIGVSIALATNCEKAEASRLPSSHTDAARHPVHKVSPEGWQHSTKYLALLALPHDRMHAGDTMPFLCDVGRSR